MEGYIGITAIIAELAWDLNLPLPKSYKTSKRYFNLIFKVF